MPAALSCSINRFSKQNSFFRFCDMLAFPLCQGSQAARKYVTPSIGVPSVYFCR